MLSLVHIIGAIPMDSFIKVEEVKALMKQGEIEIPSTQE